MALFPRLDSSDFARLNEGRNSASAIGAERGSVSGLGATNLGRLGAAGGSAPIVSQGAGEGSLGGTGAAGFAKRRFLYRELSKEFPQVVTPDSSSKCLSFIF